MRDVAKRVGWGLLPVVFAIVLWLGMKAQDAPQAQERQSVTAAVVAPPVPALTSELDEIRARIQAADDRAKARDEVALATYSVGLEQVRAEVEALRGDLERVVVALEHALRVEAVVAVEEGEVAILEHGVEKARPAPDGTRGSIVLKGEDMKMLPDVIAKMVLDVYEGTRRVTREPGNLVEVVLSTVVTSNATTVDPFPITGLAIHFPAKDKAES